MEEPYTATTAWHLLLVLVTQCCGIASHSSTTTFGFVGWLVKNTVKLPICLVSSYFAHPSNATQESTQNKLFGIGPHTQLCCSTHKCVFLTNVAPNILCSCRRLLARSIGTTKKYQTQSSYLLCCRVCINNKMTSTSFRWLLKVHWGKTCVSLSLSISCRVQSSWNAVLHEEHQQTLICDQEKCETQWSTISFVLIS